MILVCSSAPFNGVACAVRSMQQWPPHPKKHSNAESGNTQRKHPKVSKFTWGTRRIFHILCVRNVRSHLLAKPKRKEMNMSKVDMLCVFIRYYTDRITINTTDGNPIIYNNKPILCSKFIYLQTLIILNIMYLCYIIDLECNKKWLITLLESFRPV